MSFPAYSVYRDSGAAWIGPVPADWGVCPLLAVADECNRSNRGMVEDNLLSLSYGSIVRKDINTSDGLLPESFETYQVVEPNDIVWRLTDLQNDKRSLRTAIVRERGIITSAYLATQPHGILPAFLSYLLRAYDQEKVFYSMGGGLRQSMKYADVRRMPIIVPSQSEQIAIAAFLDRETVKIDALVEEQRRLIDLLKEKRQAAITHAVTKGLDPTVPMKNSGVEWLGQVPAHWATSPLRWSACCSSGNALPNDRYSSEQTDACYLPVYGGNGLMGYTSQANVEGDALVIGRVGALCGNVHIAPLQVWVTDNALVLRLTNAEFSLPYVAEALRARCLNDLASKSAQPLITGTQVQDQRIPQPSLAEQTTIVSFVSQAAKIADDLASAAEEGIVLLRERRAALIAAAVTGKIDVRDIAAQRAEAA